MEWLKLIHGSAGRSDQISFRTGDEVRVWFKILEKGKERLGQFSGIVIRQRGSGVSRTFTVRRVTHGEGVERVFPMDAKVLSKIEVLRQGSVKRSRLYFLRSAVGKTRLTKTDASSVEQNTDVVGVTQASVEANPAAKKAEEAKSVQEKPLES